MTTKTPWTAGPWAQNINSRYPIYQDESHAKIAACLVDSQIPEEEREANLRLITLAPEMAEALRYAENALGENLQWVTDLADLLVRQKNPEALRRLEQMNAGWIALAKLIARLPVSHD